MSLFPSPDEHATNPPASWRAVRVGAHAWQLQTAAGVAVGYGYTTRKEAEADKTTGPYVRLYEQESRWYAGHTPPGWKPYAQCLAEREQADARATVVELAARLGDWAIDHSQDAPDPQMFAEIAGRLDAVELVRMVNRLRDAVASLNRHEPDGPDRAPAAPLGEVWDAPARVWRQPDGGTTLITAVSVHVGLYLEVWGGPPSYEGPRYQFGAQVIARAATPGQADAFAVFWRLDGGAGWRQVTGDLPEADMIAWDGRPVRLDTGRWRSVMDDMAAWLDQVAAAADPAPAQADGVPPAPPITVISKQLMPAVGGARYQLSSGWFIDGEEHVHRRPVHDHKYAAYEPGAHPSGCAALRGTESSLARLLARLNETLRPQAPAPGDPPAQAEPVRFVSAWADTLGGAR